MHPTSSSSSSSCSPLTTSPTHHLYIIEQSSNSPTMKASTGVRRAKIYAKSTAVSSTPVKPGKTYPLSTLDHAMGGHVVRVVFYYKARDGMSRGKIKESLSEVLGHYPAVTGRMMRRDEEEEEKWVVKCNDAGARLLDAKMEGVTLDEWLAKAGGEEEMAELVYWEEMGKESFLWSPYYIQITEFADKSIAIGLSCTQMHADPTCAILFIKAWGDIHRRSYIINPPFFHPPGLIPRAEPNLSTRSADFLALKSKNSSSSTAAHRMSSATFQFSDDSVKCCLSEVNAACPDATPFDALASLFWHRIKNAAINQSGPSSLTLCVDFRKSMHAPLPHGFYGNAVHFSKVEANLSTGWGQVAAAVNRHIAGLEEEEYWSAIDWFGARPKGSMPFQMYGPELTCVKLDHTFAYGAVFEKEGGKPVHVSLRLGGAEGEGVVIVMPAAEEGMARTVVVTLPEDVANKVCKDDAILRHGPKIMFRG